jgi:hypothetical protein
MIRHTMLPGKWFMTCDEEQVYHNDYNKIDHLATHGLSAIKLIEQQPYGPLTNKATLGQIPIPKANWNPVSEKNKTELPDLYFGVDAPRYGVIQALQASLVIGFGGWVMGWRYGLTPIFDHIKNTW